MTSQKLQAALTRMIQHKPDAMIDLIERIGRSVRVTQVHIQAALVLTKDRLDFIGHGNGRNVRSIEHKPIDRTANWAKCWNNSGRGCVAFHADQRTAV